MDRELRYRYVNKAYEDWFGMSQEQCLRSTMFDVLGSRAVEKLRPFLDAAYGGTQQSFEAFVPYLNGGAKTVRVQYIPDREKDGRVVGVIVIASDVSNERQRELSAQLEESRKYLRLIIDSSQHGMWGTDMQGQVTFINRRALELLGYEDERELLGKSMHEMIHYNYKDGTPHPKAICPMRDTFINRNTHHVLDDVLWRRDGTSFPISYYSVPILMNDECLGSVVTFEDITLQKSLESSLEQERLKSVRSAKLASLGEMSAGIAHEINNPLAVLTGTVTFLAELAKDPEKLEAKIEVMRKNCARIARIVRGLQKFSRTGDKPNLQNHSIAKIVQEAMVLTEARARRQSAVVTVEGESTASIHCDDVEIEQVIINLVNNAIDAVKDQKEDRWIKILLSDDGEQAIVRVMDSGPGIPEDVRHRLFEPFFTTKEIGQGTGLGLSITKGILDEHKATIAILPNEPHTCFEIRFKKIADVLAS